jgi:hypothetical protein
VELRRPENCPKCGSTKFMEILYGRPTDEAWGAIERGEIILGGCFVMPGQPHWKCASCGHEWFDPEDPAWIKREELYRRLTGDEDESIH